MAKLFMPEITDPRARIQILQDNADKIEESRYLKPLTQEELDLRREQLTDNSIKLSDYAEEKKEILASLKEKMEPLKMQNKTLLTELRSRQAQINGRLYHIADHDSGMMEMYDETGELISSRRLLPEERQATIMTPIRKVAGE